MPARRPGTAGDWAAAGISAEALSAVEATDELPEPLDLRGGETGRLKVPSGLEGPFTVLSFEYVFGKQGEGGPSARPAEDQGGGAAEVRIGGGGSRATFRLDENAKEPRPVQLCVPLAGARHPILEVRAVSSQSVTLTNIRWSKLASATSMIRPTQVSGRGDELIRVQFSVSTPSFYVRGADGIGTTCPAPFSRETKARLFDLNLLTPLWSNLPKVLGLSTVIRFGEATTLEGVLAVGAPGSLSEQAEGLLVEALDAESGGWAKFGAVSGPPQYAHGVFGNRQTTGVRVTSACRKAVLSELLVFAGRDEAAATIEDIEDEF